MKIARKRKTYTETRRYRCLSCTRPCSHCRSLLRWPETKISYVW